MTTVVYPSARLSANGATALLDTVDHGVRVCELPTGSVRWDLGTEHDLSHISLSASGNAVAWVEEDGQVAIQTDAGRTRVTMPASRPYVRAIAISDSGEHVAALIAGDEQEAENAGRFIVVPRQVEDEQMAVTEMLVYDGGSILANDDCSLMTASSFSRVSDQHDSRAIVRDGDALRPLWTERTRPAAHGALALYGDWLFAATADGLVGWRRTGEQVTLPGVMRERMIFSPQGSHLLTYRADEGIEVTSAQTLFRLIDLTSLREVRRANHLIDDRRDVQFVLDAGFSLYAVRATRAGELVVKELAWNDDAALTR